MRNSISIAGVALVLASPILSLGSPGEEGTMGSYAPAASAGNRFTFELYARLAGDQGNLFLSPHSIHVALAMASAGARGATAEEMQKVLHVEPATHPAMAALLARLNASAGTGEHRLYQLSAANALWGQKGLAFRKEYLELVRTSYDGELSPMDFRGAGEAARKEINSWVEARTAGKIKDLIRVLSPETLLVLTNAIYFKSAWQDPFQERMTKEGPFHLTGGGETKVPFLHQVHRFGYREGDGFQAVELPYNGHALSMLILLPGQGGLAALEKKLTADALGRWLGGLQERKVDISLPKFKLSSRFELGKVLRAMGMTTAFKSSADFSGIAAADQLFIGEVIHQTFVDVNEEGTEAAAATAVVMLGAAARREEEKPVVFRADHPFLFLIRHRETGAILFMGRLADPGAPAA